MSGDGLEAGLDGDAYRALRESDEMLERNHKLDRWLVTGATSAKVAVVKRRDERAKEARKLVLKLSEVYDGDLTHAEYRRHQLALSSSDFAKEHLAELVGEPVRVGDGRWITFQHIANHDLDDTQALGTLLAGFLNNEPRCTAEVFATTCRQVVAGALGWAGRPYTLGYSLVDVLTMHFDTRLRDGASLAELVRSRAAGPPLRPDGMPNPFALLRDEVGLEAPVGHTHGDLHVENVLVTRQPGSRFWLVDLARYQPAGPVSRDPVHLLLHMVNRALPRLDKDQREAVASVLLDPDSSKRDVLPVWLSRTITEVYAAGDAWILESGYTPEWELQRLVSILACCLILSTRASTRPEDRDWFEHLAARAAATVVQAAYPEESWPPLAGRGRAERPPSHPKVAPVVRAAVASPPVFGRDEERREFDDLVDRADAPVVLNIYGPGGIGKTEVLKTLLVHGRARGILAGDADVGMCAARPSAILEAIAGNMIGSDLGGTRTLPLQEFRSRIEEHAAIEAIVAAGGGLNAMFDAMGGVRDQATFQVLLEQSPVALPRSIEAMLHNRFALDRYLRDAPRSLAQDFGAALGEVLDTADDDYQAAAVFLDTYERVGPQDRWAREALVPALPAGTRLVILGRNPVSRQNIDWTDYGHTTRIRQLPELAEDEAKRFLRHYGASGDSLDDIYRVTGGYPLLLVLARQLALEAGGWAAIGGLEQLGDRDRMAEGLLDRLLQEDSLHDVRDVLEKCAIASWIDPGIIKRLLELSSADEAWEMFKKISKFSFVERHPHGVRLHEKVRDLLIARLQHNEAEYNRLNAKLLEYHQKQFESPAWP